MRGWKEGMGLARPLAEQHGGQLAPAGLAGRVVEAPGIEQLEQLLARGFVVPGAVAADRLDQRVHGGVTLVIGGQVQADSVYFGQDDVSRESVGDLQDAADFRRARVVMQGVSHDVYRYVFGVDFALGGRPSFLDVYLEHFDLPVLQNR